MSDNREKIRSAVMATAEAAFRFGFKASAEQLEWTEDEAWAQAREKLARVADKMAVVWSGPTQEREESK